MALEILYAVGAFIVLAALIYGTTQYNRRNRANETVTEKATKELYTHPDRYEARTRDELRDELKA